MSAEADRIRSEYARRAAEIDGDRYAFTNPAQVLIVQEAERLLVAALVRAAMTPLSARGVLEVGCGAGGWLARFALWGAAPDNLAGIDLVPERAAAAAARLPGADIREGDASRLPWDGASFDVVFQSMMFSSVLDADVRRAAAAEMDRVLRPGGVVLWYDFFVSEPRNASTRGMRRSEIASLFPGFSASLRRATLAPPLARVLAPRARPLATALSALRMLDTHLVGTLRKP